MLFRYLLGRFTRFVPFLRVIAIGQLALQARRHFDRMGPGETRRLAHLVRHARTLSPSERDELRALTAKLEPRAFAGAAAERLSPLPLPRRLTRGPKPR